jgi:MtN3 and saliva related transmembrane protein
MNIVTITGIAASLCTSASLIPQLLKVLKEKKAKDISMGMMMILFAGLGLWVYYGILIKDIIVIIANSFSFLINLALGIASLKYKKKERHT